MTTNKVTLLGVAKQAKTVADKALAAKNLKEANNAYGKIIAASRAHLEACKVNGLKSPREWLDVLMS